MLTIELPAVPADVEARVQELEAAAAELVARQLRGERVDRTEVEQVVDQVLAVRRAL